MSGSKRRQSTKLSRFKTASITRPLNPISKETISDDILSLSHAEKCFKTLDLESTQGQNAASLEPQTTTPNKSLRHKSRRVATKTSPILNEATIMGKSPNLAIEHSKSNEVVRDIIDGILIESTLLEDQSSILKRKARVMNRKAKMIKVYKMVECNRIPHDISENELKWLLNGDNSMTTIFEKQTHVVTCTHQVQINTQYQTVHTNRRDPVNGSIEKRLTEQSDHYTINTILDSDIENATTIHDHMKTKLVETEVVILETSPSKPEKHGKGFGKDPITLPQPIESHVLMEEITPVNVMDLDSVIKEPLRIDGAFNSRTESYHTQQNPSAKTELSYSTTEINLAVRDAENYIYSMISAHHPHAQAAIRYLEDIRQNLAIDIGMYSNFLELIDAYMKNKISTREAMSEVAFLFRGDDDLIRGFQVFLPNDYSVTEIPVYHEPGDMHSLPSRRMSESQMTHPANHNVIRNSMPYQTFNTPEVAHCGEFDRMRRFDSLSHAMENKPAFEEEEMLIREDSFNYILIASMNTSGFFARVNNRLWCNQTRYMRFLEIVFEDSNHVHTIEDIHPFCDLIEVVLSGNGDLLAEFYSFIESMAPNYAAFRIAPASSAPSSSPFSTPPMFPPRQVALGMMMNHLPSDRRVSGATHSLFTSIDAVARDREGILFMEDVGPSPPSPPPPSLPPSLPPSPPPLLLRSRYDRPSNGLLAGLIPSSFGACKENLAPVDDGGASDTYLGLHPASYYHLYDEARSLQCVEDARVSPRMMAPPYDQEATRRVDVYTERLHQLYGDRFCTLNR